MKIVRRLLPYLLLLLCMLPASAQDAGRADSLQRPATDSAIRAQAEQLRRDSVQRQELGTEHFRTLLKQHPMLAAPAAEGLPVFMHKRAYADRTADFYLLLLLTLLLGLIRFSNPRYFSMLWRAFYHPTHTSQALRDQLDADPVPNIGMNVLFACSMGAYLYALLRLYYPYQELALPPALMLGAFILGVALIYAIKWIAIRASGWAFGVSSLTAQYLFNVYLINKIMAVLLIPFTIFLAFADKRWAGIAVVISAIVIVGLVAMRYTRSWMALRSFFSHSRFHFLTYFCASEILPLAVLTKFVARALFP